MTWSECGNYVVYLWALGVVLTLSGIGLLTVIGVAYNLVTTGKMLRDKDPE